MQGCLLGKHGDIGVPINNKDSASFRKETRKEHEGIHRMPSCSCLILSY